MLHAVGDAECGKPRETQLLACFLCLPPRLVFLGFLPAAFPLLPVALPLLPPCTVLWPSPYPDVLPLVLLVADATAGRAGQACARADEPPVILSRLCCTEHQVHHQASDIACVFTLYAFSLDQEVAAIELGLGDAAPAPEAPRADEAGGAVSHE